jgi:glycosyltransferase involved in cell wall biosynthesis
LKKKIVQIGPYSATGGVSIHIKRLTDTLKEEYDFSFIDESPISNIEQEVFNLRSGGVFKYISLIRKADVVHIHSGLIWLQLFHILAAFLFRKKIIITIHSLSILCSPFRKWIMKRYLILTSKVIVVSQEMFEKLNLERAIVKEAFIPPNLATEETLPEEVLQILQQNKDNKIIVSNAFRIDLYNDEDLYGLDLMIEVAKMIKEEKRAYKIIFIVASSEDKHDLVKKYYSIIDTESLSDEITILNYPISFVKLVMKSDVVIRATNTDGDALTIREALYFNKPVIASDVVKRPDETILFKTRDAADLYLKIKELFETKKNLKPDYNSSDWEDASLQSFYSKIYN